MVHVGGWSDRWKSRYGVSVESTARVTSDLAGVRDCEGLKQVKP
jgi:hypothetical protein